MSNTLIKNVAKSFGLLILSGVLFFAPANGADKPTIDDVDKVLIDGLETERKKTKTPGELKFSPDFSNINGCSFTLQSLNPKSGDKLEITGKYKEYQQGGHKSPNSVESDLTGQPLSSTEQLGITYTPKVMTIAELIKDLNASPHEFPQVFSWESDDWGGTGTSIAIYFTVNKNIRFIEEKDTSKYIEIDPIRQETCLYIRCLFDGEADDTATKFLIHRFQHRRCDHVDENGVLDEHDNLVEGYHHVSEDGDLQHVEMCRYRIDTSEFCTWKNFNGITTRFPDRLSKPILDAIGLVPHGQKINWKSGRFIDFEEEIEMPPSQPKVIFVKYPHEYYLAQKHKKILFQDKHPISSFDDVLNST